MDVLNSNNEVLALRTLFICRSTFGPLFTPHSSLSWVLQNRASSLKMAEKMKLGKFWIWVAASLIFRLVLIYFPNNLNLASRPEVSTPITSLRHLAEGNWLKQASLSLYAGSMYHGSLLLLSVLGPLTVKRIEGQPNDILCR
ncbi:GPI transamidase subunit PIG-U [Parasponia andersonii]|uniref:GPI transamidase subunit PIG-U n=1 Tax=Parasponia andersonii TaxID=3476 RepID=A0A2P5CBF1_PARAD|nr:GPI transamidase subunit PIG-U [Parasponia andersonii]